MPKKPDEIAERYDGGQAFPATETHPSWDYPVHHPGMTIRDWFAGRALQGMLASGDTACENYAEAAHYAFTYADTMLAERSK